MQEVNSPTLESLQLAGACPPHAGFPGPWSQLVTGAICPRYQWGTTFLILETPQIPAGMWDLSMQWGKGRPVWNATGTAGHK